MNGPVPARERESRNVHYCERCGRRLKAIYSQLTGICGPCSRVVRSAPH